MADTPTISTSVPQPVFSLTGITLPTESAVLSGCIVDLNAAFGNNLTFYNSAGTFLSSRPQSQIVTTNTAVINSAMGLLVYLASQFDPATATGRIQDGIASINFLTRNSATYTSVPCTLTGAVGTIIAAGVKAQDTSGNIYANAGTVTIGSNGTAQATFNCLTAGAVQCPAGTLTVIYQIVPGWDSITNPSDGVTGTATESRADFEARRQESVSFNAIGINGAILAAVKAVDGVIDAYVADNKDASATTIGGVSVPAHGVLVSVSGGTDADVGKAIWSKLSVGTPMAGSTTVVVQDDVNGYLAPYPTDSITFQRATGTPIYVKVTITDSDNIPQDAQTQIQTAALSTFNGTGTAETNLERINSTIYGSAFVADIVALGSWALIISVQVSLDGTTYSDTVSVNAAQIPTLTAANITMVAS